ncbi:MAG: hypothetical protein J7M32_03965 [Deltaproteobacteria bacterium]|nr:hypothetical protein [Deltaproteobacteria bacterium]
MADLSPFCGYPGWFRYYETTPGNIFCAGNQDASRMARYLWFEEYPGCLVVLCISVSSLFPGVNYLGLHHKQNDCHYQAVLWQRHMGAPSEAFSLYYSYWFCFASSGAACKPYAWG